METWKRTTYPLVNGQRSRVYQVCFAYTEAEAKEKGVLFYDHYRDIPLKGSGWFKTSDGMIVYCRKREHVYAHQGGAYVLQRFATDLGSFYYSIKNGQEKVAPDISFTLFKAGGCRPLYTKNDYLEKIPKHRLKAFVAAYVQMLLTSKVDYDVLGRILKHKQMSFKKLAIKTLALWKVQEMVKNEMIKALEKQGITPDGVVNKFEEAYAVAKGKKDAQTMTRIAENYAKMYEEKAPKENPHGFGELPGDTKFEEIADVIETDGVVKQPEVSEEEYDLQQEAAELLANFPKLEVPKVRR